MYGFGAGSREFSEQYHCFSGAFADKAHLEEGDKILLPTSAFEQLARLQIEYPMLFELKNGEKRTHCGVLEFTAPEGHCYLPFWMMQNLMLEEGGLLTVKNVSLPKATFVKFQPQHVDFLQISNPRAVLERQLRHFSCVTVGDQICIPYNDRRYYLEVREVKPQEAACIIECDCNVDFDAPVGYVDPSVEHHAAQARAAAAAAEASAAPAISMPAPQLAKKAEVTEETSFAAFTGGGARLDGKALKPSQVPEATSESKPSAAAPAPASSEWGGGVALKSSPAAAAAQARQAASEAAASPSSKPQPKVTKWSKNKTNGARFGGTGSSLG